MQTEAVGCGPFQFLAVLRCWQCSRDDRPPASSMACCCLLVSVSYGDRVSASIAQWCVGADPKLADNATNYAPFYSDPKCISLVQNTINTFLNRINTGMPSPPAVTPSVALPDMSRCPSALLFNLQSQLVHWHDTERRVRVQTYWHAYRMSGLC